MHCFVHGSISHIFTCAYVSLYIVHMCISALGGQKKMLGFLGPELQVVVSHPTWCSEQNSGPLQDAINTSACRAYSLTCQGPVFIVPGIWRGVLGNIGVSTHVQPVLPLKQGLVKFFRLSLNSISSPDWPLN